MSENENPKPLTLDEFRATKVVGVQDAKWCREQGIDEESVNVALYAGSAYIFINGANSYNLLIANEEWNSDNLAELEEILYRDWYLPEVAGVSRDTV